MEGRNGVILQEIGQEMFSKTFLHTIVVRPTFFFELDKKNFFILENTDKAA